MPEPRWSAIATLIMMQSTMTLSLGRIVASALGASVGAIEATYFGNSLIAFGLAVFLLGLMSFASRLDKPGYRYASVTLAIVVLTPRAEPAWLIVRNSGSTCRCRGLAGGGAGHYFLTPQSRILSTRIGGLLAAWQWPAARGFVKP
jgi:Aromatic acid exporter family member 1